MIPGGRYHNFHDLFGFPNPPNITLHFGYLFLNFVNGITLKHIGALGLTNSNTNMEV